LAKSGISKDLREALESYESDIAEGDFEEADRRCLRALYQRLSKRRRSLRCFRAVSGDFRAAGMARRPVSTEIECPNDQILLMRIDHQLRTSSY
jgi:hypothetical protein